VGLDPRVRAAGRGTSQEPRFFADAMLGRLARWLRILGYDTVWEADVGDAALVRRALEEARIVVTRDRRLAEEWRGPRVVVLRADGLWEQLRELARRVPLDARRPLFRRCTRCNTPVEPATREQVAARVPARTLREHDAFTRCPRCGHVYWEGGHARRIRARLEAWRRAQEREGR
jgi:uncharacterized protein with PIN domain